VGYCCHIVFMLFMFRQFVLCVVWTADPLFEVCGLMGTLPFFFFRPSILIEGQLCGGQRRRDRPVEKHCERVQHPKGSTCGTATGNCVFMFVCLSKPLMCFPLSQSERSQSSAMKGSSVFGNRGN
jgi:hypothetical protein